MMEPVMQPRGHFLAMLVVGLALLVSAPEGVLADDRAELEPLRLMLGKSAKELSGIGKTQGSTVIVSDSADEHFFYALKLKGKGKKDGDQRFALKESIDLSKLAGFQAVQDSWKNEARVAEKDRRLDLEGIAVCGDTVYAANERVRQILIIDLAAKSIKVAPIDFSTYADLFAGEANAGFEGVAADCAGKRLFIGKERDPRRILVANMDDWKLVHDFDVAGSDRAGQKVINTFSGQGLLSIGPDFADLLYTDGFLYALERNTYEIAKIDVRELKGEGAKVIQRMSYLKSEKGLYETGEPFGIAEALLISENEIWIGFDNNGAPLSSVATRKAGVSGDVPGIYVYKRPSGF